MAAQPFYSHMTAIDFLTMAVTKNLYHSIPTHVLCFISTVYHLWNQYHAYLLITMITACAFSGRIFFFCAQKLNNMHERPTSIPPHIRTCPLLRPH